MNDSELQRLIKAHALRIKRVLTNAQGHITERKKICAQDDAGGWLHNRKINRNAPVENHLRVGVGICCGDVQLVVARDYGPGQVLWIGCVEYTLRIKRDP